MPTYKISDLVKVDDRAEFRNDVQLDHFDNPRLNLGLINSYLFSTALPGGSQSAQSPHIAPVGVLENLVQAFLNDRLDNRFSLIATYGHGKSHLALALANYFSRPCASPEVKTLLDKLNNALGDPAKAKRYTEFKNSRGEFLVLRLRGDVPRSLHEQVLQALEKALAEHQATHGQKLPFWFTEAEQIIRNFSAAEKEKANLFLENAGYDTPLLLQRLAAKEDVYDVCIKVIHHVKGIRPNLGGEVSLAHVIRWATDNFCGQDKPLGGLLILFDEFGLYVQKYAQRHAVGELQDLLNGVSDRQGRAAFLAFSQLDLMQLADNLHITGETKVGLKRELTRIPKKWVLFSLMESVVDAYLVQNDKHWQDFLTDRKVSGTLYQATDVAWERFNKRYSTTLRWPFPQFQEQVAKGCFPLHPITTYLLCNLKLQSDDVGVPRTVLGFVLEELRARQDELAVINGRPNWIVPIGLVDYFEGRLSGDIYALYTAAQRTIGEDAPEEHQTVLKSLLLQYLAEVTPRSDDQILFLAHMAGLDEKPTKQALRTLSDNNVIRYDHNYKAFTFWPASNQPKVLEETVQKKLANFQWSTESLKALNKTLNDLAGSNFGLIDIKVDWGHPTDWAAREYIVTADLLTDWLRYITPQLTYAYNHRDLIEPDRSTVIWIVVNHDDEVSEIRATVNNALQAAIAENGQNPPVLVAVVPMRPQPELLDAHRRRWALSQFSQKERDDAGKDLYEAESKQADLSLLRALKTIRLDNQNVAEMPRSRAAYMVPTAYTSVVHKRDEFSLRELLTQLYRSAFPYAPSEFFTHYRVASKGVNKLRDATRAVAAALLTNAAPDLKALSRSNAVVRDLCDNSLVKHWDMLAGDYRIREQPGSHHVRGAWQFLNNAIKPGNTETKLRDVLFPLLNPPYGYDYNTALLVFAAWFGYHRLDLEITINNRRVPQQALIDLVDKGSRDFFHAVTISDLASLRRRSMPDVAEIKARIQEAEQKEFSQDEANNQIIILHEIVGDERYNSDIRQGAQNALDNLKQASQLATQYDQMARKLREETMGANTAQKLISLQKQIAQLPVLSNVRTQEDTPAELKNQIENRFTEVIEAVCQENESPGRLTDVGLCRSRLQDEKKAIAHARLPLLTQRIDQSLGRLEQREAELQHALQESQRADSLKATIESVDPHGRLNQLLIGVQTLQELTGLPDNLAQKRDKRLQEVEKAIADIRTKITQSHHELENIRQEKQLQPVRDRLITLQQRCADTPEADVIATLLEEIETIRARLQAEAQRHTELMQLILSTKEQAPLQELTVGVAQLHALPELPSDLKQLCNNQVEKLDKAIAAIHAQIRQTHSNLEAATTSGQLGTLRNTLYALKVRCANTPEADEVDNLLNSLEAKRERLEQSERHTADMRRIIEAADPKASLRHLIETRQQLAELTDLPPELSKSHEQRLNGLELAISAIHSQIEKAGTNLQTTRERRVLNKIRDDLLQLKARCVEMPEEAEIEQLIVQIDQIKVKLDEEERQINEWRTTIQATHGKHSRLRHLLDDQASLQSLPELPENLTRERDKHLQEVEKAITTIYQQVRETAQSLETLTSRTQLEKQREKLLNWQQRCEDTELETMVAQYLEQAEALRQFFDELERERILRIDSLTTSNDQIKRIEQLGQRLQLSAAQKLLISEQQDQVKKAARAQREKAQRWLANQEQANRNNHPVTDLVKQLENPPLSVSNYLTAAEQRQIADLRQQVQARIDADALTAIETRFRQIRDRRLQEQCLHTLQQIFDATPE